MTKLFGLTTWGVGPFLLSVTEHFVHILWRSWGYPTALDVVQRVASAHHESAPPSQDRPVLNPAIAGRTAPENVAAVEQGTPGAPLAQFMQTNGLATAISISRIDLADA